MAVKLKNKMRWDDALDVWGVHGVGGVIGSILCHSGLRRMTAIPIYFFQLYIQPGQ